jgi:hypothetical protein
MKLNIGGVNKVPIQPKWKCKNHWGRGVETYKACLVAGPIPARLSFVAWAAQACVSSAKVGCLVGFLANAGPAKILFGCLGYCLAFIGGDGLLVFGWVGPH